MTDLQDGKAIPYCIVDRSCSKLQRKTAGAGGIGPSLTVLETVVLPLYDAPLKRPTANVSFGMSNVLYGKNGL